MRTLDTLLEFERERTALIASLDYTQQPAEEQKAVRRLHKLVSKLGARGKPFKVRSLRF